MTTQPSTNQQGPTYHSDDLVDKIRQDLVQSTKENTVLRALVVKHECPYGHRSKEGVCGLGYPGCACADDAFVFEDEMNRGLLKQRDALLKRVSELEKELAEIRK